MGIGWPGSEGVVSIPDWINDFLKGLVPGYGFIEHLVSKTVGDDADDYGQCRANCSGDPAADATQIATCQRCVDKIATDAFVGLGLEIGGESTAGVAWAAFKDVLKEAIAKWLEKKGLTWLAERAIPILGWLYLVGDLLNLLATLVTMRAVYKAQDAAKAKFCKCPN